MKQFPHTTLVAVLILSAGATNVEADTLPKQVRKPNILFIAVDDLRPALGCYGDPLAKSPNIDRFAKTARQFNRAYAQQAVCGPSRTSLLTGLLPDHTQVWHNRNRFRQTRPNLVTLPQLFKNNGYHTLAFGKVFSGNELELDPLSWSAPEILKQNNWKKYLSAKNQGDRTKQAAFESQDVEDEAYPDGKLAKLASNTLENLAQSEQPFFLAVGFLKPHLPFNAPLRYWNLYDAETFELPAYMRSPIRQMPDVALHSHRELGGYQDVPENEQLDGKQCRILRHGYYACVSYIDAQIGKLLNTLKRLQLDENTIIVLWGDHGFALGETNRWCKGTNFELDTRVPLLIRTPKMPHPGTATDSLVELVDLYPTLAELAKLNPPVDLDGRSLTPILTEPQSLGSGAVFSQFNRPWKKTAPKQMGYSIRTANARYTRWIDWSSGKTVEEELYDYSSSQSSTSASNYLIEQQNVAASQPDLLKRMQEQMDVVLADRLKKAKPQ